MSEESSSAGTLPVPGNCFDLCRFGLATLVLLSHSYALLGDAVMAREPMVWATRRVGLGTIAVDAFFVLSGYLVSSSYLRCGSARFYFRNRALRIYPGWVTALLISAFVVAPLAGGQGDLASFVWQPLLGGNLPHFPGAFAANPVHYINGSLWSMRFEVFCYLLVPLLAGLGIYGRGGPRVGDHTTNRRPRLAAGLFALTYGVYQATMGRPINLGPWLWMDELPRLVTYFMAGAALFVWPVRSGKLALACVGALVLSLRQGFLQVEPFCWSYLVLYAARTPWPGAARWRWLGDISFGMYLYAFSIQQFLVAAWHGHAGPRRLFVVSFALSLAAGFLSWRLVERPFLRLKQARPA